MILPREVEAPARLMGLLCTFTHKFMCPAQTSALISKSVCAAANVASRLRCLTGVWGPHPQNPFLTCQPLLSPQPSCLDGNGESPRPGAWAEHRPGTLYSASDPLTLWLENTYRRTRVNDLLSIIRWKREGSSVLGDRGISEPRLCRLGCGTNSLQLSGLRQRQYLFCSQICNSEGRAWRAARLCSHGVSLRTSEAKAEILTTRVRKVMGRRETPRCLSLLAIPSTERFSMVASGTRLLP